jgi:hypothetical protein
MRRTAVAAALLGALAACGEPPVDVVLPDRAAGEHVADLAGILDEGALEDRLAGLAARGLDVVALAYETPQASCGEAFRAGLELATAWEADVALVAVARPGDFASTADDRERCLGLRPVDDFAVGRGTRERIAEQLVPPLAADNRWDEAFAAAADVLEADLLEPQR